MKAIPLFVVVVIVVVFQVASAKPSLFHAFPTYYEQLTAPRTNVLHSIKSQFHTQDELGQYTYGYNDGLSSKIESKTTDGITQGAYSYLDSNGIIQNVNYVSDDLNGFRVFASNLPVAPTYQFPIHEDVLAQENPTQIISVTGTEATVNDIGNPDDGMKRLSIELTANDKLAENANKAAMVAAEKRNNISAAATMDQQSESVPMLTQTMPPAPTVASIIPTYTYQFTPYSLYSPNFAAIPLTSFGYHDIAPLSQVYSQFHSQDELGQYSYGYSGGPSSKVEVKTADGITRGGYSYVDANGVLQKVNYIADPVNGFRVAATNLPISNMATAYYPTEYHLPEFNLISHSDKAKSLD